ncbi:heat shock protein GrpE [Gracilibacillus halophilus YIM-C55.5]|uniref:Protein GrpE n=1 Tax=Gracilibacillus halophilus YIM-C55.5 TaxID=1308866 RepID=N4WT52_9BACI|nr:nucleotide exchange factor GrpE [Gracilibacillus halophilus]ENH97520.1 heat shock protein GrpE [Gracilibacillus halophilus YIM-C55.5]
MAEKEEQQKFSEEEVKDPQESSVETDVDEDVEVVDEDASEEVVSFEDTVDKEAYDKLEQEKTELQDKLLRVQAEYDNFRKRTKKEKEADLKYKSQNVVTELLPVLDNFERALQVEVEDKAAKSVVDGLEMVYRQLRSVLEEEGVEEIETDGAEFDPHLHQAVAQADEEGYESNQIVETMQKGYKLKDRVIRPAMVKVNQ